MFVLYSTEILAGVVQERVLFVIQHYQSSNNWLIQPMPEYRLNIWFKTYTDTADTPRVIHRTSILSFYSRLFLTRRPGVSPGLASGCGSVSCDCSFGTGLFSCWITSIFLCLIYIYIFSPLPLSPNLVFATQSNKSARNCLRSVGILPPSSFINLFYKGTLHRMCDSLTTRFPQLMKIVLFVFITSCFFVQHLDS